MRRANVNNGDVIKDADVLLLLTHRVIGVLRGDGQVIVNTSDLFDVPSNFAGLGLGALTVHFSGQRDDRIY